MSKPNPLQRQFATAYTEGHLVQQVQCVRATAIDAVLKTGLDGDTDVMEHLEQLAGPESLGGPPVARSESAAFEIHCRYVTAAFALGVAVGQLVSPDVFAKGGAR
jgi:hypothetical protein